MSVFGARPMQEREFIRLAEEVLQELDRRIEASGIDADGGELFAAVSAYASQQSGETVKLAALGD